jgi:hypothetical protein
MIGVKNNVKRVVIVTAVALAMLIAGVKTVQLHAQDSKTKVMLSHKEVRDLIKNAKEPEDHLKLAAYYRAKADEAKATVAEHKEMLDAYVANPSTHVLAKAVGGPTAMCQTLIRIYAQEERTNLALATYHENMAKPAEQK